MIAPRNRAGDDATPGGFQRFGFQIGAAMMAGIYATGAMGRVAGALTGGLLWSMSGWTMVCGVAAITNITGVLLLVWGLRGWKRSDPA